MLPPHLRTYPPPTPTEIPEIEARRAMSVGERLASVFEKIDEHHKLARVAMREKYPNAPDDEIFLRCGLLNIGRALMIQVYGWDPDLPDESDGPYSLRSAIAAARWRS